VSLPHVFSLSPVLAITARKMTGAPARQSITSKATPMPLTQLAVDEGLAQQRRTAVARMGRGHPGYGIHKQGGFMDDWVDPRQPYGRRKSLLASNITRSIRAICRQSRVSSPQNMTGVQPSIVSILSWMFYSRTLRTVVKHSM